MKHGGHGWRNITSFRRRSGSFRGRRPPARPFVPYSDAVDEALCFGWVDSGPNKLYDEREMRLFTPRNPKSPWSRINKGKVARLTVAGRMAPPASGWSRRRRRTEHGQLATRSKTWLYPKTSPRCWGITRPPGPSLRTSRPHTRRTSFVDKIRPNVGNPDETHHPDSRTRRVQSDGQSPQRTGPRAVVSLRQFPAMKRRFRLIAVRAGAHWAVRQFSGRRARSCSS